MNENRLAENIMYYRKKKGLSQEKIAEYLEVSRQAVTKWETNMEIWTGVLALLLREPQGALYRDCRDKKSEEF